MNLDGRKIAHAAKQLDGEKGGWDNTERGKCRRVDGSKGMGCGAGAQYGGPLDPRRFTGGSTARKAASAQIAKIPYPLAQHIARVFKPHPMDTPGNDPEMLLCKEEVVSPKQASQNEGEE